MKKSPLLERMRRKLRRGLKLYGTEYGGFIRGEVRSFVTPGGQEVRARVLGMSRDGKYLSVELLDSIKGGDGAGVRGYVPITKFGQKQMREEFAERGKK